MGRTTAGGQGSQPARKNTGSARLTPSFLARKASAEHEKAQVGGTKSDESEFDIIHKIANYSGEIVS
jgi:hypothetical protein